MPGHATMRPAIELRPNGAGRSSRKWDVIVVGAGPAGSVAALRLAERGHTVLLLDQHRFPREKVCGDALIPDALRSLRRCGLYEAVCTRANRAHTVSVYSPSQVRVDLPGEFLTIRRSVLDALLLEAAMGHGATFRCAMAVGVSTDGSTVEVALRENPPLQGRFAILATGANVTLLNGTGLLHRRRPSGIAVRCYMRSTARIEEMIVSLDHSVLPGYAWIFPLGDGEYNVGVGVFYRSRKNRRTNLRANLEYFLTNFPPARQLRERLVSTTALRGAMLRCGLQGADITLGDRIIAIGESIGTTFPFTGEGIGKAMETGELAAQQLDAALRGGDLAPVRELATVIADQLRPRYAGYRVAEAWASNAWLTDLLAKRIQRTPALQRAAAGILSETVDPHAVFQWRNLLRRWAS